MPIDTNVSVNGSLDIKQIIIKGVTSEWFSRPGAGQAAIPV